MHLPVNLMTTAITVIGPRETREVCYQELANRADSLRARHPEFRAGARIALLAKPGPEWIIGFLACLRSGATAILPSEPGAAIPSDLVLSHGKLEDLSPLLDPTRLPPARHPLPEAAVLELTDGRWLSYGRLLEIQRELAKEIRAGDTHAIAAWDVWADLDPEAAPRLLVVPLALGAKLLFLHEMEPAGLFRSASALGARSITAPLRLLAEMQSLRSRNPLRSPVPELLPLEGVAAPGLRRAARETPNRESSTGA